MNYPPHNNRNSSSSRNSSRRWPALLAFALCLLACSLPSLNLPAPAFPAAPLVFTPTPPPPPLSFLPLSLGAGVPGPAGPAGRDGLPGTDASGLVGVNAKSPPAGLVAALGNGTTDDAAALQAAIQYCQDHNLPLLFPPGVYKITSPLHISLNNPLRPDDQYPGPRLAGLTPVPANDTQTGGAPEGATIKAGASGMTAVIQVDAGVSVHMEISDLRLSGGDDGLATKYAIYAPFQKWTQFRLDNVLCCNVDTDIAVTGSADGRSGISANGEQLDCYSCNLLARHGCYLNSSDGGQAYAHRFFSCGFNISQTGGVMFEIGGANGTGGCQVDVYGMSGTMHKSAAPTTDPPSVFFLDHGCFDPINWWGGRCEGVDTVFKYDGGGAGQSGHVNIQGMSFPNIGRSGPLIAGGGTNTNQWLTVRSCYFTGNGTGVAPFPKLALGILTGGFERIKFDECDFLYFGPDMSALTGNPHVSLTDCRVFSPSSIASPLTHS